MFNFVRRFFDKKDVPDSMIEDTPDEQLNARQLEIKRQRRRDREWSRGSAVDDSTDTMMQTAVVYSILNDHSNEQPTPQFGGGESGSSGSSSDLGSTSESPTTPDVSSTAVATATAAAATAAATAYVATPYDSVGRSVEPSHHTYDSSPSPSTYDSSPTPSTHHSSSSCGSSCSSSSSSSSHSSSSCGSSCSSSSGSSCGSSCGGGGCGA